LSTNLALPINNWTRLATNLFDANGKFLLANPLGSAIPSQFYLLQLP